MSEAGWMPNVAQLVELFASNGYQPGPLSYRIACVASLLGPKSSTLGKANLIAIGTLTEAKQTPRKACLWAPSEADAMTLRPRHPAREIRKA